MRLSDWVKQVTKVDASEAATSPSDVDASASNIASSNVSQLGLSPAPTGACNEPQNDTSTGRWCGFIDRVTLTAIEGWAQDTYNPDAPAAVEVVTSKGGRIVAIAHLYRKDVEEAGFGNGRCGFFLDLSKLQLSNESAVVRFVDSRYPITKSPIEFDPSSAVLTTDMPQSYLSVMEVIALETRQALQDLDLSA